MPIRKTIGWIGVDLGSHAVKLAQLERRGAGFRLAAASAIRRRAAWDLADGPAAKPLSSEEEIRAGLSLNSRFVGRAAAATAPMAACLLRGLRVPPGSDSARRQAVAQQFAAAEPAAPPDAVLDWWPTDVASEAIGRDDNVYAVATSADWSDRIACDQRAGRLNCRVLDVPPWPLARALSLSGHGGGKRPVAALDWGLSQVTLAVVREGAPMFVRRLRECELSLAARSLAEALEISTDDALSLLARREAATPTESDAKSERNPVQEAIRGAVARLGDELERTLEYLATHRRGLAPEAIVLFGAGAMVPSAARLLEQRLDRPVAPWRPTERLEIDDSEAAPLFGPAIALSLLAWEGA